MINYIIVGILALLLGAVISYLVREKKKGVKCIGCPYAKQCASKSCSGRTRETRETKERGV